MYSLKKFFTGSLLAFLAVTVADVGCVWAATTPEELEEGIASIEYVNRKLKDVEGTIPAAQVQSDWTATTGMGVILNKPTIPTGKLASKDAVGSGDITDGTIVNADISANAAISTSKISGLATVATSGSYNDLTNKPTIPAAQVQSDWNATTGMGVILNKPTIPTGKLASKDAVGSGDITDGTIVNADISTNAAISTSKISGLATVATSGSYDDLTDKPTIPAAQVQSDWTATTGMGAILNKPTLATVATSGSYNDLTNKPTIPAAQVQSDWNATTGMGVILNKPTIPTGKLASKDAVGSGDITDGTIVNADISTNAAISTSKISGLATVATSGSYDDLTDKPTIPAAQVQSDWTATTGMGAILNKPTIPTGKLASKDAVGSGDITNGTIVDADISANAAIGKTKLATEVQNSLTAADTAVQSVAPTTAADGKYVTNFTKSGTAVTATTGYVKIPVGSATAPTSVASIWVQ